MLKMLLKLLKNMNQKWAKCIDKTEKVSRGLKQETLSQAISWKWQVRPVYTRISILMENCCGALS